MKFQSLGSSVGSKLIPRRQGPIPAIERTVGEKIRLAQSFLEKHNFVVMPDLWTRFETAEYLGCSINHITNLLESGDFSAPYDISSRRSSIDKKQKSVRWRSSDIIAWLESTR